jgi:hypothetical protein
MNTFLLLSDSCGFVDVGHFLWEKDGFVVWNCCWPSPGQSFSDPSPVGLAIIFYTLRFETFLFVASFDSQGYVTRMRCAGNRVSIPKQRSGSVSVSNSQFRYPRKLCFVMTWFPGTSLSVAKCLPIRFLETAHMSQHVYQWSFKSYLIHSCLFLSSVCYRHE